jgi:tRNA pseudouridine38-40 synthase
LNQRLPPDIHVVALDAVADRFHARHAATARSYLYQIALRRTALAKRFVWWVREPLDLVRMNETVTIFRGRHDFVRFCERPAEQASTVVVVDQVELARCGGLLLVRIVASHFLWRMVRRVVGAMVRAGAGAISPDAIRALLGEGPSHPGTSGAIGSPAEWTAPASGLFLERVLYPGDPPLGPLRPIVPVGGDDDVP